ncbi:MULTISPECIES: hypothetical protein [unclassified Mesorhizobium]|uniref:hypothetical protein n=1 Tax=unclassified Mesorhizobium TaxID=325217 RepID=UPI00112935A9|nr:MULTISPECIES: hypothetical protein [unclassified Mesorhizobium]TPK53798.1 hypothetical protein FJ550_09360 [Mesorhizobium sp. B2-5-2]TPL17193.1 hypothetical protein FJ946_28920 [Mesorhizobium sp. B2-4-7]TPL33396.1 hypothetical protein FJ961_28760 [Mesorhizobium sp. B2-4-5]TPM68068.1 hypothetical protein FJ968_30035 [Mesorhizobium sp. B2-1-6]TPN73650.1 hypothetical protein FJ985_25865 [Mesorhizobium sp. B1-1-2]
MATVIRRASCALFSAFIFGAALLIAGCATPYIPPKIQEPGQTNPSSFGGIMSFAKQEDLRVVWVHGMCTHDESWADNRHALLERAIAIGSSRRNTVYGPERAARVTFNHSVNGHSLELRFLVWSPLAAGAKIAIGLDHNDELKRASLNKTLKEGLIDDCFSDAVIYTGASGDPTRSWIRSEVCDALGGRISAAGRCLIDDSKPRRKTILIAESLGSKMLSDAIVSIWQATPASEQSRIAQRLGDVQMVFLLANQIPLLNAATYSQGTARIVSDKSTDRANGSLLDVFASARARKNKAFIAEPAGQIRFVAFTDPNDLLSYRLFPKAYLPKDMKITNVIVSNDQIYLGLLERPDTAHCGYGWNPAVIATVAQGYDGKRLGSIPVNVPHSCGLGG